MPRRPNRYSASRRGIRGRLGAGLGIVGLLNLLTPQQAQNSNAPGNGLGGEVGAPQINPVTGAGGGNGRPVAAPVLAPAGSAGGSSGVVAVPTAQQGGAGAPAAPATPTPPTQQAMAPTPEEAPGGGGAVATPTAALGPVAPIATATPIASAPEIVAPALAGAATASAPQTPQVVGPALAGASVASAPNTGAVGGALAGAAGAVAPSPVDPSSIPPEWRAAFGLSGGVTAPGSLAAAPTPSPAAPQISPDARDRNAALNPLTSPIIGGFSEPPTPTELNGPFAPVAGGGGAPRLLDHGGVIDEPVFGRGLRSGKEYLFAANGRPERVTPLKNAPLARSKRTDRPEYKGDRKDKR